MSDAATVRSLAEKANQVDLSPKDPDRAVHFSPDGSFVVAHDAVGKFSRGDVVSESDVGPSEVSRLLDLKAIVAVPGKEKKAK